MHQDVYAPVVSECYMFWCAPGGIIRESVYAVCVLQKLCIHFPCVCLHCIITSWLLHWQYVMNCLIQKQLSIV